MRKLIDTVSALYQKPPDEAADERTNILQNVEDDWRLPNLPNVLPREHLHPVVKLGRSMVMIYRGVPAGVTEIRPGDWVALTQGTAMLHQRGEHGHVISQRVPAADVVWAGTDVNEYHYVPR